MELTIQEFIEKTYEIEELRMKKKNDIGVYEWETTGNNQELREYISKKLKENLILTDAYLFPGYTTTWIKKEYIDTIIDHIKNSNNYDEMKEKLENVPKIKVTKIYDNDIIENIRIEFRSNYGHEIKRLIAEKLKSVSSSILVDDCGWEYILVNNTACDIKEQCKHQCKTSFKKQKFDEIFNI